jgi:hypothetical protein
LPLETICIETERQKPKINWYRSPVSPEQLRVLNQRSDFKGFLQTGAFLGLLTLTGSAAYFAAGRLPWPLVVLLFLLPERSKSNAIQTSKRVR